jgi:hypothetical protein
MKSQVKSCYILKFVLFLRNNGDYSEGIIMLGLKVLRLEFPWILEGGLPYPGPARSDELGYFGLIKGARRGRQGSGEVCQFHF